MANVNVSGAVISAQEPNSDWGFVYLIGHRQMPDVYKIGKTINHPKRRCHELGRSTSAPGEFSLLMFIESSRHGALEASLHAQYADLRVAGNREFFRFTPTDLGGVILSFSEQSDGLFRVSDEDGLIVSRLFSGFPYLIDSVLKCYPGFPTSLDDGRTDRDVRDFVSDNADEVLVELAGKGVI